MLRFFFLPSKGNLTPGQRSEISRISSLWFIGLPGINRYLTNSINSFYLSSSVRDI